VGEPVSVDALLRVATAAEVSEGLERNPGSNRLAERGWQPLWFEAVVGVGDATDHDVIHSLVWREPRRPAAEVADEELEHTLDEVLRQLRDAEGYDVELEDVVERRVRVEVDAELPPGHRPAD
jgi:hypothetical protein